MNHELLQTIANATAFPVRDAPHALPAAGVKSKQAGSLNTRSPLFISCWNVRTLLDPGSQCITMRSLCDYGVSIGCLSEVRIPGTGCIRIKIPGRDISYWLYHSGPTDNSGLHGVAIALDAKAQNALTLWEAISPRILVMRFRGKPVNLSVLSVYAPTMPTDDASKDAFYEELQKAVDKIPRRDMLIIAGDWNARTGEPDATTQRIIGKFSLGTRCENGERMLNFASFNRLTVTNTRFQHPRRHLLTWYSNDGRTAHQLDHILVRSRWNSSVEDCRAYRGAETGNANGTDHVLLRARIKIHLSSRPRPRPTKRINTAALNDSEKRLALSNSLVSELTNFEVSDESNASVDSQWNHLKSALQRASIAELGMTSRKRKDWLSEETLKLSDKAREARLSGSSAHRSLRRQATRSARHDRNTYWECLAKEMENASSSGQFGSLFRLIRISSGRRNSTEHPLCDLSGSPLCEPDKKVERWAEHFSMLLNRPAPLTALPTAVASETYNVSCDHPTRDEIIRAIGRLRNNKSPGEDGVPPEVYKACSSVLIEPLHDLYRKIWELEELPRDWGTSLLIPILKKGNASLCDNYRGISLIDIAAKVFAVILLCRFTEERDIRTRVNQGGFRRGRGCVDQLFTLRRILEHRYRYQQATTACFIDFQAAFDSVDRDSLWSVMLADGMPEKLVRMMQAYYSFTQSRVRAYGMVSSTFPIRTGVRQGCPLSPVLFNFAIDWTMKQALSDYAGVILSPSVSIADLEYADDIVILGDDPETLQTTLERLSSFASMLGLRINTRKTKYFTTATGPHLPLKIGGENLEMVNTFRYLGSCVLPSGQARDEIPTRVQAARTAFSRLRWVLFSRREISRRTKLRVYRAAIRPVLTYGCETWPVRVEDMRKLEVFDHWCLRRILNVRWDERVTNDEVRHRCFDIPRLSSILRQHRLRWFGHILRRSDAELTRMTLSPTPCAEWRCRSGGQVKTWLATVRSDVELLGLRSVYGWRTWDRTWLTICADLASNRRAWAAAIRDVNEADSSSRRR